MQITKGLNFIKLFLIITISLSMGFIFTAFDTETLAEADADQTESVMDSRDLDTIVINNKAYKKDRRGPVNFAHKEHAMEYGISCWECHHDYKDGENVWSPWKMTKECAGCHDATMKKDNMAKLQTAFHLSCKGCHKKRAIYDDDPLSYRKCNTCHEKTK